METRGCMEKECPTWDAEVGMEKVSISSDGFLEHVGTLA